ncbi:NACHT domain-containing protein [Crossiella cryophila]
MLLVTGLAWLTLWLLGKTGAEDGAGIANVLALPATALGTLAALLALRTRPRADDPTLLAARTRTLLDQVHTAEARTLQRLLGDTGEPQPANVAFAQPEAALLSWRTDGGASEGTLNTIAAFYRSLTRGRLVILGEPGAGKTVLAIRLLLDLAAKAEVVPVRLSLPAFRHLAGTPAETRDRLDRWIAEHLITVRGIEPAVAQVLIADGRILPVLDGLDEMDPDHTEPHRARSVLAALNLPAGTRRWPVIVTCRSTRYQALEHPLQDATAVTMRNLKVEQVIAWLAHRFPDPSQPDGIQARWRPVVQQLRRHPNGRLAQCLTNPLRLYLAVTVYQGRDTSPKNLRALDADALEQHLFGNLVAAVTAHHARADGSHYGAEDVQRWLHTFAAHLGRMGKLNKSTVDLKLHELWRTTGRPGSTGWGIRLGSAVLCAGVVLHLILVYELLMSSGDSNWFVLAGLALITLVFNALSPGVPRRIDLRAVRTAAGRRFALYVALPGLLTGTFGGLEIGIATNAIRGILAGAVFGLGMAFVFVVALGLVVRQQEAVCPSEPMRQAIIRDLVVVGAFGLVLVVMLVSTVGMIVGIFHGRWEVFVRGLPSMIAWGLLFGTVVGAAAAASFSPWPRYVLAVWRLSRTNDLPTRPAQFLDWAYTAGLVRLSGIAVQFRHRELQRRSAEYTPIATQPTLRQGEVRGASPAMKGSS